MDTRELVLTTSRGTNQCTVALWDPSSGSTVHYYKNGGHAAPKTLNLVGYDYVITADDVKPMVHAWSVNSQEPVKRLTTILPEKITVMSVCPKSTYLAAGIGVKLYVWHLSSGKLFAVQKKNYQPITCIKFSNDGGVVVVGGEDGMVVVYDLASLVSFSDNYMAQSDVGQVEPLYTKKDHHFCVTDVHVGLFGAKSRLVTASRDCTCKIYDLSSGTLLVSLVFEEPATAVIFDAPCWNLYTGLDSGKIQQFHLTEPPRTLEQHVDNNLVFVGHEKRITCLCLTDNQTLISAAEDCYVLIWEQRSREILRKIKHDGVVTNVRCVLNHPNFFEQNVKPKFVLKTLNRDLNQSDDYIVSSMDDDDVDLSDDDESRGDKELESENARLRTVNRQLYDAALQLSRKYHNF